MDTYLGDTIVHVRVSGADARSRQWAEPGVLQSGWLSALVHQARQQSAEAEWLLVSRRACFPTRTLLDELAEDIEQGPKLIHGGYKGDADSLFSADLGVEPGADELQFVPAAWLLCVPLSSSDTVLRVVSDKERRIWIGRTLELPPVESLFRWLSGVVESFRSEFSDGEGLVLCEPGFGKGAASWGEAIGWHSGALSDAAFKHLSQRRVLVIVWTLLDLEKAAALVQCLRDANVQATFMGAFFNFDRFPEQCYLVGNILGTPPQVNSNGLWRPAARGSFNAERGFKKLQPLLLGASQALCKEGARVAIIGSCGDEVDRLARLLVQLKLQGAVEIIVFDTGAPLSIARVACYKQSADYISVPHGLAKPGEAGRFIEACSLLPDGRWTVIPLESFEEGGIPVEHLESEAEGAIAAAAVDGERRKMFTVHVGLRLLGLLSGAEVKGIDSGQILSPGPVTVGVTRVLLEEWAFLLAQCRALASQDLRLAFALLQVVFARTREAVHWVGTRSTPTSESSWLLLQENRPELVLPEGYVAVVHVVDPSEVNLQRVANWRWGQDASVVILAESADQIGVYFARNWRQLDAAKVEAWDFENSGRMLQKISAECKGLVYMRSDVEPLPGAAFPEVSDFGRIYFDEQSGGPYLVCRSLVAGLLFDDEGYPAFEAGPYGDRGTVYSAAKLGWVSLN